MAFRNNFNTSKKHSFQEALVFICTWIFSVCHNSTAQTGQMKTKKKNFPLTCRSCHSSLLDRHTCLEKNGSLLCFPHNNFRQFLMSIDWSFLYGSLPPGKLPHIAGNSREALPSPQGKWVY